MRCKQIILAMTIASLAAPVAAQATSKAKPAAKPTVYCIEYEKATGSRLKDNECLSKAEWAKRGVDVDRLQKQ